MGAKGAAASGLPTTPYFVNAPVDFFLAGGASIVVFALLYVFSSPDRSPVAISLAAGLLWVVNWPHFSATSYRLYQRRANIRQYPMTAIGIPILVAAAAAASLGSPAFLAPAFVHLFVIWSPYHFSGQSVGVTLLYARRTGFAISARERLALSSFIFGTFVLQVARSEGVSAKGTFWGVSYPTIGLPQWAVNGATYGLWLAAAGFAALVAWWWIRDRRPPPLIVLVPALSQFTWFALSPARLSYVEFVPFFHSLQYLLIAWAMQINERLASPGVAQPPGRIARASLVWWLGNVAGGALLFWVIPHAVAAAGYSFALASGVMLAAVQIHHFFVDGVIWKLKDPAVRSPLMGSLKEVLSPRAPLGTVT